ncbi:MAG TPA: phospho-N-acetylmuramoyl-pentapeptide-transferase [Rectinemataceae bacterium]|nr:phospho-N-acetylmuramoyl-pentapeptide-transferase [Rectinemataceae bacterium]
MLYLLGQSLQAVFGPFRLLASHSLLMVLGLYAGFLTTMIAVPKLLHLLPRDRGKEFAAQPEAARGKPTGTGIVFMSVFVLLSILTVPLGLRQLAILAVALLVSVSGYLDDRSVVPWGEYSKGLIDLILAAAAGLALSWGRQMELWLPFSNAVIHVSTPVFVGLSTLLIWLSINSTNCSDGVDGLSGTLAMISLVSLALILYFVLGNAKVAKYLLLPHYADGADWAIMIFTLVGCLAAYLWYNANPSRVLMGDAGSRALGFLIGVMVMNTGNPFLLFVIAGMILLNGGTGLIKVALLRFLKIRILHNTRFPLHDHARLNVNWSNSQVLLRFAIVQILLTIGLFGIFIKIR